MGGDTNKPDPDPRSGRLSSQMIDAIIAYGDDRTESNFDRLKALIVRYAGRGKQSAEAAAPKGAKRKSRSRKQRPG
jgi:hypothetical protein